MNKHKVFISYHHENDQDYKEELLDLNKRHNIFIDQSVDIGDISAQLSPETTRTKIRDEYLQDSSVTILLVGTETKNRKAIDQEIYSSMIDGERNKKSGILVINLPSTKCKGIRAPHGSKEKNTIYPDINSWTNLKSRVAYEKRYPYMPERIIDNLYSQGARISVVPWSRIENNPSVLGNLIDFTYNDREKCNYDFSRDMMRRNTS